MTKAEKTYRVTSLGCRTNQYEAQAFRDQLKAIGFREAQEGEEASICVVNTCTVTESADAASRHEIRKLIRENPEAQVAVTGCLAERRPDLIQAIGGVSVVIPNTQKESLVSHLLPEEELPEFQIQGFEGHTRAFVKVQDGCNSFCTYCIIPYVRGRSKSRTVASVVQEVESLVVNGFKEVVITGINVGDFDGGDKSATLADLIRAVDKVSGIERIRLSSIDPDEVDDNLMDAILSGSHTCPSMHIVLQAGSNVILKRMNRKYTRQIFLETIDRLRKASSDFTFTTDIIVGFPGESEADFEETLAVMREVEFAKVHFFPYSPRERTRAATFSGQLSKKVLHERKERLLELANQTSFSLRNKFLRREMEVLLENSEEKDFLYGHTSNFLKVAIQTDGLSNNRLSSNNIIKVELIENREHDLLGRIIS